MTKSPLLAILLTSALVPAVLAHTPAGTPKDYCEDPWEWGVHDYGSPATGLAILLQLDGNLAEDCNGDTIPADFDGHSEFAFGGAWLLVNSGDGVTGGTLACYGEAGHHLSFGPFSVDDAIFGSTIAFRVESDSINLVPPTDPSEPNCGDFQTDESASCVGSCYVTFPEGLDGAYVVYACGTAGHIGEGWSSAASAQTVVICPHLNGLPPVDPDPVYAPGPAAVMLFDGSGGSPTVIPAPGWSCTSPILSGGLWEIECFPPVALAIQGFLPACTDPWGAVGGTPVSSGTGTVRVSCKQFFGGFASASCSASWIGAGGCPAILAGFYDFPLRCAAFVTGTTIGGNLFATCGHV